MILSTVVDPPNSGEKELDLVTARAVTDLLDLLPADVREDLVGGQIAPQDPAFLEGLADHVARLSLANPTQGRQMLGKLIKLKKQLARGTHDSNPAPDTIMRSDSRPGRNAPCPCGSGRKFKQCCLRKTRRLD